MKLTFKQDARETGLASVTQRRGFDIKYKKQRCGRIRKIGWMEYKVSFTVVKERTQEDPAPFKWVTFAKVLQTPDEAKEFAQAMVKKVCESHELYFFED